MARPPKSIAADAAHPLKNPSINGPGAHTGKDAGKEPDTTLWLTRRDVQDLLKIGNHTILYYEDRGLLRGRRVKRTDAAGAERLLVVYDPRDIAKLPRRHQHAVGYKQPEGEIAARAFELFELGKSDRELVIEIRETPDKVVELREKWLNAGGADLVITPAAKEALEDRIGEFGSVAELVARVLEVVPAPAAPSNGEASS